MVPTPINRNTARQLEDPLVHLPRGQEVAFARGETIYDSKYGQQFLYLVLEGQVRLCRGSEERHAVLVDIYRDEEFFGEAAFIGNTRQHEIVTAIRSVKAMVWEIPEIEKMIAHRPILGIALMQLLIRRSMEFGIRIESFCTDTIPVRLARTLVRLAERLGRQTGDGAFEMPSLTHEMLAQYVGTSREIITHHMNRFRRQGYLRYSRRTILVEQAAWKGWPQRVA